MKPITRESLKLAGCFALWCTIVALRSMFTHPYEILWFTGNIAALMGGATCGYIWHGMKPYREDARRRRRARRG